jgi:PPOX class probable F420-dependent enzyme
MDPKVQAFLENTSSAAMITLKRDGTPVAVRVGITLVDGKLWSSGTEDRKRTGHLRRDPRATLFVFDPKNPQNSYQYLGLETVVTILEGPRAHTDSLRLFQAMQGIDPADPDRPKLSWFGRQLDDDAFLAKMQEERRLIYEFEIKKSYGLF